MKEKYFSVEQLSKTGNLDANLVLRQNRLDLMSRFLETESVIPKLRWDQLAKVLGCSSSTLQRYRQDIKSLFPYTIPSNRNKTRQKTSCDLKRAQKTSKEPNPVVDSVNKPVVDSACNTRSAIKPVKEIKKRLKVGSMHETDDEYLNENLYNVVNKKGLLYSPSAFVVIWMEAAMLIVSTDEAVRSKKVQGLKDFNSQFLETQANKGEQLVFSMPSIEKLLIWWMMI